MSVVVVEIGCIECGETSDLVAHYPTREAAEADGWTEDRYLRIFDVPELTL